MADPKPARLQAWFESQGVQGTRRLVRESEHAIVVSKFEPGFAPRLFEALDRIPELFDHQTVQARYGQAGSGVNRVEAWRNAINGILVEIGPQRGLDADQVAEIRAGTDSVAALLDSVLWSGPLVGSSWLPAGAELEARDDAIGRMNDESSIFTRYYGDFEGKRVENHCPGARVARRLFAQAWEICTR